MLCNASAIIGYRISASDGHIGTITDLLFDDSNWRVRWFTVETGHWLASRKVLLPSSALLHTDSKHQECVINLTIQQIKDSPAVETARPVSRQMESSVYGHYGYRPYWNDGSGFTGGIGYLGGYGYDDGLSGQMSPSTEWAREVEIADARRDNDDVHLRSVNEVIRYHIHASDGEIGYVTDFLIDDSDWSIRYLVSDTKNWWPGRKVLISPRTIRNIDWSVHWVNVNADRQTIMDAPEYDASVTIHRAREDLLLAGRGVEPTDA